MFLYCFFINFKSYLDGNDLLKELKEIYRPHKIFSYFNSRTIMYNFIDCYKDEINLLYSGVNYKWNCKSQDIPDSNYVNAEHIVPQSLFNKQTPQVSDLHHLYSSGYKENNYRSNYLFVEVPYEKCTSFIRNNTVFNTLPSNPDEYSCRILEIGREGYFMPIKKDRGIIARAIFYFLTIYPEINISSILNISLYKKWNIEFPPTKKEIIRNEMINITQGNRNPYIDNYLLINRAFL